MISAEERQKLRHYKAVLIHHLSDPAKLRLSVVAALTLLAVGAVYVPLSDRIASAKADLARQQERREALNDVETLRKQVEFYRQRLRADSDTNQWVQHILAAQRHAQVKLRDMESREPRKVGPYTAVALAVEVEGTYPRLAKFVEWLEQSERLLRIDSVRFEKQIDCIVMRVVLLGLVEKQAKPPKPAGPDGGVPR